MIDGTPARLVTLISMRSVSQFLGAYSSRYRPAPTPSGTARNAVTSITRLVPTQADRMPARSGRRDGKLVRKSHDSRPIPSIARSTISAISMLMATSMTTTPAPANSRSAWRARPISRW